MGVDTVITSRRNFLGLAAATPLALLAAASAGATQNAACYDPAALPFSQKSRRRSIGYVEASADPRKSCGACAFFTAGTLASCGSCQLLSAGPVNAAAVCNSFAAKARS